MATAGPGSAAVAVETLFAAQRADWPTLDEGLARLARTRVRPIDVAGFEIEARHIPHRMESTTARVDPESIQRRPCFLCPDNLPRAERGLAFGESYVLLCNPAPILERHLSIVSRRHVPQRIAGRLGAMLDLARSLPGFFVLYNGPECGASAPDHLHFQACLSAGLPLVRALDGGSGRLKGYPCRAIVLAGGDPDALSTKIERVLALLAGRDPGRDEPMVNVVALHEGGSWTVVVFPRAAHRPRAYHSGQLMWSPGAIDLCGVTVLPRESDFERVTAADFERGFDEVSVRDGVIDDILGRLGDA